MPVRREGKLSSGELKNKMLAGLDRGLILAAMLVAQQAQRNAPVDTGRLKRSITQGRPYSKPMMRRAVDVGTSVEYAHIQEFGGQIPPHLIRPRTKEALAFEWPGAPGNLKPGKSGKYVFRFVNHPGATIPPQPYLRPALQQKRQEVKAVIVRSILGAI